MALNYAQAKRKLYFQSGQPEVTVETAQRGETVSAQELINQIHLNTLLPKGIIETVVNAMTDSVKTYFTNGHGCYIGRSGKEEEGLGILYPTLHRTRTKQDDGTYKTTALSVGAGFRPSTSFKAMLDTISVNDISADDDDDTTDSGTSSGGSSSSGTNTGDSTPSGGSVTEHDD